jgi:hypothetical protein
MMYIINVFINQGRTRLKEWAIPSAKRGVKLIHVAQEYSLLKKSLAKLISEG